MSFSPEQAVVEEVLALHRYLTNWLRGESDFKEGLQYLKNRLTDDFEVVHPSGQTDNKEKVIENFRRAFGNKSQSYSMVIRVKRVQRVSKDCYLARYRESHQNANISTRISTAVISLREGLFRWHALHETACDAPGP